MKRFLFAVLLGLVPRLATAADPSVTAIDILLHPDATMLQHATATNERLRKVFPKGFALDASHRPHITLVQRFVLTENLDKVYAAVGKVFANANEPSKTSVHWCCGSSERHPRFAIKSFRSMNIWQRLNVTLHELAAMKIRRSLTWPASTRLKQNFQPNCPHVNWNLNPSRNGVPEFNRNFNRAVNRFKHRVSIWMRFAPRCRDRRHGGIR